MRHLEITVTNYRSDPSIAGYVVNFRDISDRIALEEQLRQAQKMEAVNQLAGGIAHDFNNTLTAIVGNVAVLLEEFPAGDDRRELLSAIDKAAQRAAHLTNRLLVYSRRSAVHLRPIDINRVVRDTVSLLRPSFDPRIVVDFKPGAAVWPIMADADQVEQVITNICLNSRDAMPRGGRLSFASANIIVGSDSPIPLGAGRPGDYVQLTIEDTGFGMTPEVRAHVFEPFFTTKPTGAGTGLGLAMVYGIVKSHGGWVDCESEAGAGTRMAVYLPRAEQSEEQANQPETFAPPIARKAAGETVLLVDDEPSIRTLGAHILEKSGYRVLLAEDGIDAVEMFREIANQVALVILDLTMPRMSGADTFRRLREIKADVRVLFSSGYSAEHLDLADLGAAFIGKPYRPAELIEAVRTLLPRKDG
jgi:two-component system, cell cycle sensor histidine kinase and response regulator CckA